MDMWRLKCVQRKLESHQVCCSAPVSQFSRVRHSQIAHVSWFRQFKLSFQKWSRRTPIFTSWWLWLTNSKHSSDLNLFSERLREFTSATLNVVNTIYTIKEKKCHLLVPTCLERVFKVETAWKENQELWKSILHFNFVPFQRCLKEKGTESTIASLSPLSLCPN